MNATQNKYVPLYKCTLKLTAHEEIDTEVYFTVINSEIKFVHINMYGNMLLALKDSEFADQISLPNISYRTKLAYDAGDCYKLQYNNHEVGFDASLDCCKISSK